VDDEEDMLEVCSDVLSKIPGVDLTLEARSERAAERLGQETFELLVTDLRMPRVGGLDLVRLARERDPQIAVLVLTAFPSVESAVEAMKVGAGDYVVKPFLPDDLLRIARRLLDERRLRDENRLLERHVKRDYVFDEMVGRSPAMLAAFDTIRRVAPVEADVIVMGETGTGKELAARSIHKASRRSAGRFVPVDCGAIPDELLESEFFGHERGAFTGAHARSLGLLEFAHQGTFFLDEIGELSPRLQAKLLRVLQERRIRRVGGREEIPVDVRIIAATSRNLADEIKEGRFREDLFYRINVTQVKLPPLRERRDDVPLLLDHFVARYAGEMGKGAVKVEPDVVAALERYHWPGNVREMQNLVRRALAMCRGTTLTIEDLPDEVVSAAGERAVGEEDGFFAVRAQRMAAFEREYLAALMRTHLGDVAEAAVAAHMPRGTLYRLLKKHEIDPADFRDAPPS